MLGPSEFYEMSLEPRVLPLRIHAPVAPDSYMCSTVYGQNIIPSVCQNLVDSNWPSGNTPIHIYHQEPAPSNAIVAPYTVRDAGCTVTIEAAGPRTANTNYVAVAPNKLRGLAAYVIQKCPIENNGYGGFVTIGLAHAATFVEAWILSMYSSNNSDNGAFS